MATQTLSPQAISASFGGDIETTAASAHAKPLLRRLLDFIVATQTHRAQRAIAMHIRSRGLEFTPLDAEQPPH